MALTDKLTAIGDAIRNTLLIEDLIPLAEMPGKVTEVFNKGYDEGMALAADHYNNGYNDGYDNGIEVGKQAESDAFWDMFQDNGNRNAYDYAFYNWSSEYICPKYKVVPTAVNSASNLFYGCTKLKKVEADYFDLSQKPTGTNNNTGYYYTFNGCIKLEEIEDIGLIPQYCYIRTFSYCYRLHTIAKMGVNENTIFSNVFTESREIVNLTIVGTIGQNGFDVSPCTKLTHDSLMSIINALKNFTDGTTRTVTLGTDNLAKLTDEEKAIAIEKGWTLA